MLMHNAGCSSLQGWQKGRKYLPYALAASSWLFVWTIAAQLAAGTCILIWLCDWVKDKGLSDGYTLVFGLNIAAGERRARFQLVAGTSWTRETSSRGTL